MLTALLGACTFKALSFRIGFSTVWTADVSGQRVRKHLLTSGLKFSFDMLPGGWWGGKAEDHIGLHSGFQRCFRSWLGR